MSTVGRNWRKPRKKSKLVEVSKQIESSPKGEAKRLRDEELQDARIAEVINLLAHRHTKGEVKIFLRKSYGIGARQAEDVISEAKKIMLERANQSMEEALAESSAFYNSVIKSPNRTADQVRAQENLDEIFGLKSPKDRDTIQQLLQALNESQRRVNELASLVAAVSNSPIATTASSPAGVVGGGTNISGGTDSSNTDSSNTTNQQHINNQHENNNNSNESCSGNAISAILTNDSPPDGAN